MSGLFTFVGAAVCFACMGVLIKQLKPELLPLYAVACAVVSGTYIISLLAPVISYVKALGEKTELPAFFGLLFKAVGVSLLCGTAADICRACGEGSLANGVESAGKAVIVLLSLPVVKYLLDAAIQLGT